MNGSTIKTIKQLLQGHDHTPKTIALNSSMLVLYELNRNFTFKVINWLIGRIGHTAIALNLMIIRHRCPIISTPITNKYTCLYICIVFKTLGFESAISFSLSLKREIKPNQTLVLKIDQSVFQIKSVVWKRMIITCDFRQFGQSFVLDCVK